MPTYEYQCPQCGRFDYFQSIKAQPLAKCPQCGSEVKRLISVNGNIVFRGSGFYTTDYGRSKEYKEKAKVETGSGTGSSSEKAS